MTNQQNPSIGRIVHYNVPSVGTLPAIINDVYTAKDGVSNIVGLFVMSPKVGGYTAHNVRQGDEAFEWNWPPIVPLTARDIRSEHVTEIKPIRPTYDKPEPTYVDILSAIRNHGGGTREPERLAFKIARMFDPDITEVPE